jgi:hypothetical protein
MLAFTAGDTHFEHSRTETSVGVTADHGKALTETGMGN